MSKLIRVPLKSKAIFHAIPAYILSDEDEIIHVPDEIDEFVVIDIVDNQCHHYIYEKSHHVCDEEDE